MMTKTNLAFTNFKAKPIAGNAPRRLPNQRSPYSLGRMLEETTSRGTDGCINQDWQFDFVCPVLFDRMRQAQREYYTHAWAHVIWAISYGKICSGPQTFAHRLSAQALRASRIKK